MEALSTLTFTLVLSFCSPSVPTSQIEDKRVCKQVVWDVGLPSTDCTAFMMQEIADFQTKGLREMRGARCMPEHGGIEQGE